MPKRVAGAGTISEKLDVVCGKRALAYWSNHIETLYDVHRVIYFTLSPEKQKRWNAQRFGPLDTKAWAAIGHFFAMQMVDRDHKFFSSLGAALQYQRKINDPDKLYFHILAFCLVNKCGTAEAPADKYELWRFLKPKHPKLRATYDNQIPSSLKKTCDRIGVIISTNV